jgi:glutathione reductase (NADPH)
MRARGITLVSGAALLIDVHTVNVGTDRLFADQILIATGAHPPRLPIPGIEHALTHVEMLRREEPPARLIVIGGGIIAFEFAYMFARLGTWVSVIEVADHVLNAVDWEVRAAVLEHARRLGINVHVSTHIEAIERSAETYLVSAQRSGERLKLEADGVLLAAGQEPTTENLGLDKIGVALDHGIITDETLRTTVPTFGPLETFAGVRIS